MEDCHGRRKFNQSYSKRLQLRLSKNFLIAKYLSLNIIKILYAHVFRQTMIKGQHLNLSSPTIGLSLRIMSRVLKLIMEGTSHTLQSNFPFQMDQLLNNLEQPMLSRKRVRVINSLKYTIKSHYLLNPFNQDRNPQQNNN